MTDETGPITPEEERAYRRAMYAVLRRIAEALERAHPAPRSQPVDLDSKHGDPKVRFKPRGWEGDDFKGRKCSECTPDFLDAYASALEYFVEKNPGATDDEKKKKHFDALDAARVRAWAKRLRSGWKRPEQGSKPGWEAPAIGASPAQAPTAGEPDSLPPGLADTSDLDDEPIDEPL